MSLTTDTRGQALWRVLIWFVGVLISLWIFVLLFGNLLEPLAEIALGFDSVEGTAYETAVQMMLRLLSVSGLLLGIGAIALIIIFAVWREAFLGQRRPGP